MGLAELDGFLTGLVSGPAVVPESQWMPLIWGSGFPRYRSVEQRQLILDLLTERYEELSQALSGSPEDSAAVYIKGDDDELTHSAWAGGFLQAMELRPEAWLPLIRNRCASIFLMPLLSLYREAEDYSLPFNPDLNRAIVRAAAELVPACAFGIKEFWNEKMAHVSPMHIPMKAADLRQATGNKSVSLVC